MYALVEDNNITKLINNPQSLVIGDVRYPAKIFSLWSKSELEAIGIYEVITDSSNKKDEQWYVNTSESYAFADSQVTRSWGTATAKPHADVTQTINEVEYTTPGLKTKLIKDLKITVANELAKTDWYITRNTEKSTAIPSAISTHRDAVRTKQAEMETAITNALDTPALETLHTYVNTGTEENPVMTRPLGELPILES
jgi:hypothetical protein|tara:strand:- start:1457 stop:2050 length:594 start_codon:yes stop_codon:yes gene_type:complete